MRLIKLATLFVIFLAGCGPTIYKSQDFDNSKQTVKKVAILPFSVTIDTKRLPKGITVETLRESEQKTGYDVQNNVYTWFLKRNSTYTVEFQDVDKTNAILKTANINYDNIIMKEKGELCKLLNVDAVISGKFILSKPMSEGAAVVLIVLVGVSGATNKADVTLTIHDTESKLLWKFDHEVSGSLGSSSSNVTKALMQKSSKKFPYTKK